MEGVRIQEVDDDNGDTTMQVATQNNCEPQSPLVPSNQPSVPNAPNMDLGSVAIINACQKLAAVEVGKNATELGKCVIAELKKEEEEPHVMDAAVELFKNVPEAGKVPAILLLSATALLIVLIQPMVAIMVVAVGFGGFMYSTSANKSLKQIKVSTQASVVATLQDITTHEVEVQKIVNSSLTHITDRHTQAAENCVNRIIAAEKVVGLAKQKALGELSKVKSNNVIVLKKMDKDLEVQRFRMEKENHQVSDMNNTKVRLRQVQIEIEIAKQNAQSQIRLAELEKERDALKFQAETEVQKLRQIVDNAKVEADKKVAIAKANIDGEVAITGHGADAFKNAVKAGRSVNVNIGGISAKKS